MGNCESSLNCNKCYSRYPIKGCDTEIDVNPDIAGIGVLTSFFFSAFAIFVIVVWGYMTKSLPPFLFSKLDHYTLQLFRKRRQAFEKADLEFKSNKEQEKCTRIMTGLINVLSDQQLITGVSILVAGFASNCQISIYEFNIVVYLAFFAIFTHQISLAVLREYLYEHKLIRKFRVIFTNGFILIFCFSYAIRSPSDFFEPTTSISTLNGGNLLQCIFQASKFGKKVHFRIAECIIVLGALLVNHAMVIGDLYLDPPVSTVQTVLSISTTKYLQWRGFSANDSCKIVSEASRKYSTWFGPHELDSNRTRISLWYFLDEYYASYMSVIPGTCLGMAYGCTSIVLAIWYGGLKPSSTLKTIGFGQVVAIGLLALLILAAAQIVNQENVLQAKALAAKPMPFQETNDMNTTDTSESSTNGTDNDEVTRMSHGDRESMRPDPSTSTSKANMSPTLLDKSLESLVLLWARKERLELESIKANKITIHGDDVWTARILAKFAAALCFIECCIFTFFGIGLIFPAAYYGIFGLILAYWVPRVLFHCKVLLNLIYFIREEIRTGAYQRQPMPQPQSQHQKQQQQQHSRRGSVRESFDSAVALSIMSVDTSSTVTSSSRANVATSIQRSITDEGQEEFGLPGRHDTEADLGIISPTKRKTFFHQTID